MVVFLELNRLTFEADEAEVVTVMLRLAADQVSERELGKWLQDHTRKRKRGGAV
jgi:prophage maintenance system killer protein